MHLVHRKFVAAAAMMGLMQAACGQTEPPLPVAPVPASGVTTQALEADACHLDGTWAFKFIIPVEWPGNTGIQGGQGTITQWAKAQRTHENDTTISDSIVACGSTVPNYKSQALWGAETFGTRFPDALFDTGNLPVTTLTTRLSGSTPGATYSSDVMPIELGLALTDPLHDKWPANTRDLLPFVVDSDGDGYPGISLDTATGVGMSRPPVTYNGRRRATQFYVAVRDLNASNGNIVSCDRFEGTAEIPQMDGKPALHSRILGCRIEDGTECSKGELTLANMFQPPYRLVGEAKAVLVRVPNDTPCATIRAMDF